MQPSRQVVLYLYGGRGTSVWWKQNQGKLGLHDNLSVIELSDSQTCPWRGGAYHAAHLYHLRRPALGRNGSQEVTLDPVVLMGRPACEL